MKINTDYQTTSNDFNPDGNMGTYYHKKLDSQDTNGWKKDTSVLIRATRSGIDYVIKFTEDGNEITPDHKEYEKVKNWKFYASYKILDKMSPDNEKKRYIPKKLKDYILDNQNNKCVLCGNAFEKEKNPHQFDHKIEMSFGGKTNKENLQALCKWGCHEIKTMAFKKAKINGYIDPFNWTENNKKEYFTEFIQKIISGPMFNTINTKT